MNRIRGLAILASMVLLSSATSRADAAYLFDCPFNGGGGDLISRGFYIDDYRGTTLDTVTLRHRANTAGTRTIQLLARSTSYGGALIGIATVTRSIDANGSTSVFQFDNVTVASGSRITFKQLLVAGDAGVTFDVGDGPCENVTETQGTSPPLDAFQRSSVGVVVTGEPESIAAATIVACPFSLDGTGGGIDGGFYVTNYGGVTLDRVRLRHSTDTPGVKSITLVARLGTFDGPVIGSANVTRDIDATMSESSFDFHDRPLPAGSTVTFTQSLVSGTTHVFFDGGYGPCDDVVDAAHVAPPDQPKLHQAGVKIDGRVASDDAVQVVEYFHTGIQHYFMTADPDEIAGLDAGAYGGVFVRTGAVLYARNGPVQDHGGVCRFFTVAFAPKGSHFYTEDARECGGVKQNPHWQYEKVGFFVRVPVDGDCGFGASPVYRMFNNGMTGAPNHRFTSSLAVYNDFVNNQGWAGEGIRFCHAPPVMALGHRDSQSGTGGAIRVPD